LASLLIDHSQLPLSFHKEFTHKKCIQSSGEASKGAQHSQLLAAIAFVFIDKKDMFLWKRYLEIVYRNGSALMSITTKVRAAAAQFHIGADLEKNLATCLRALDKAGAEKPDIVVLPEFCNHLSWYDDQDHCRRVSVDRDSQFLRAIAEKAKEIGAHVVINVTLNRSATITTGTSILFGPDGSWLADNDKQVLIGHENDFLVKATHVGPLTKTSLGTLGLYACMDGVINETPRGLSLRGGQILLNSLNSFASDEGSLHIPVRAAENKVFVVAANKIGPLVPEEMVEGISQATGIPVHFLDGAGESQIVAPDGTVVAMAPVRGEAIVFAEFDPTQAITKTRPDGTDIFAARRPELYGFLSQDPAGQSLPPFKGVSEVKSALVHGKTRDEVLGLLTQAFDQGARIVAIAPTPGLSAADVASLCPADCHAGLRLDNGTSLLVTQSGVALSQEPIHTTGRFGPARANGFETLETPYGRMALVAGDDGIFPEAFRMLAMRGAEIAIAPVSPLEDWELRTGLLERAAENRVNLLAPASGKEMGFAAGLQEDFTVLTEWKTRAFDGLLSQPILTRAKAPITHVMLYPSCAANKVVSRNTDLLAGRPWYLADALTK
jgi:nitrilase